MLPRLPQKNKTCTKLEAAAPHNLRCSFISTLLQIATMHPGFYQFKKRVASPANFRLFMLTQLPSAFFAGLRIELLDETKTVVSVRQKWFNKNPFHSIYFAILSMAAEVSTGLAAFSAVYKRDPPVSMLVIANEGKFYKKATDKILFTCIDIAAVHTAVEEACNTGQPRTITCHSVATNQAGEKVAEFYFTWSFKAKAKPV